MWLFRDPRTKTDWSRATLFWKYRTGPRPIKIWKSGVEQNRTRTTKNLKISDWNWTHKLFQLYVKVSEILKYSKFFCFGNEKNVRKFPSQVYQNVLKKKNSVIFTFFGRLADIFSFWPSSIQYLISWFLNGRVCSKSLKSCHLLSYIHTAHSWILSLLSSVYFSKLFELIKLQIYTVPATFIFDSLKT